jgi:hypothetical protein
VTTSDNFHELREPGDPSGVKDGPDTGTADSGPGGTVADEEPRAGHRRRNTRRTAVGVIAAATVATAAGLAASGTLGGGGSDKTEAPTGPAATAKVERTTLKDTVKADGKLGYGDVSSVLSASSPSGGPSLVTWVPKAGDVITRGGNVYSVNQQKTPLLYGNIPIYRTLSSGDSGSDVKILEENLKALGYDGFTADSEYTSATAAAVEEWQDDLNRDQTGVVKPGEAVVAPGPRKVAQVKAQVAGPPNGVVLSWTGTEKVVTLDLASQYEDLVKAGTKAKIELPNGSTVEATVTDIGAPSNAADGTAADAKANKKDVTLPVEMKVENQKGLGEYQAASVDVLLESKARKDVLAVPISALVARNGGGYALEVVKPSAPNGVEYVPVKLGMFSDSMVEVSGAGIAEGSVVGVPR